MPAIQITRLRIQVARLIEHFSQPEQFTRSLAELLDFYADRARRPGRLVALDPIQKQYRVHPAVITQIMNELAAYCQEQPDTAVALGEWLWRDTYHEPRLLAAGILAALPPSSVGLVADRLIAWAKPVEDRLLIDVLLKKTAKTLMENDPRLFRKVILTWLKDSSIQQQSIGLRALCHFIQLVPVDALPDVFKLLTPLPVKPASYLMTDLENMVVALYQRSPGETLFYLQELAAKRQTPETKRFLRGCVSLLREEDRDLLRSSIK
ncbi:MAG: DNA alkylation repair protein [Anaerolineaceae bacterium]|nr:DNA alkylation repair protein [Anaerolineaceae bacterium]